MDIPSELVEAIKRGNAVLFVGAGLSIGAGLPSWKALIEPLADSIKLSDTQRSDLLQVTQYYENTRGRQALLEYVCEKTDTTGTGPTDNHWRLAQLGIQTWITTNYDNLLEQTLREAGQRHSKVVREQDVPYTSADRVTLIKLHGDREQVETIVITRADYSTYALRYPRVKDKLSTLLAEKTFLFVGYSVGDPDFNQWRDEVTYHLGRHGRRAYAIMFDVDSFARADLKRQNIDVLDIQTKEQSRHSELLGKLLDVLIQEVHGVPDQAQAQVPTESAGPKVSQTPKAPALGGPQPTLPRRTNGSAPDQTVSAPLPQLTLKLFLESGVYQDEIAFIQPQPDGVTQDFYFRFSLALQNEEEKSAPAKEIDIRVDIYWSGVGLQSAPEFTTDSPGWKILRSEIQQVDDQPLPAMLEFRGSEQDRCGFGHPLEWNKFRGHLYRKADGYFSLHYRITSASPHTTSTGELRIALQ